MLACWCLWVRTKGYDLARYSCLQLFYGRGYELRGEDAESVGSVCTHNNHENPEGCEVMSRDIHPTRGTRIHPKGLQSPLEVGHPQRDRGE